MPFKKTITTLKGIRMNDSSAVDTYGERFGLNTEKKKRMLKIHISQVSLCRSDEARRLLLGVSRKEVDE